MMTSKNYHILWKKWNIIHFSLLPKKKSCHYQQKYKNVAFTIQNIFTFSYDKILEVKLYVYLFVNDIWKDFVQKQLLLNMNYWANKLLFSLHVNVFCPKLSHHFPSQLTILTKNTYFHRYAIKTNDKDKIKDFFVIRYLCLLKNIKGNEISFLMVVYR